MWDEDEDPGSEDDTTGTDVLSKTADQLQSSAATDAEAMMISELAQHEWEKQLDVEVLFYMKKVPTEPMGTKDYDPFHYWSAEHPKLQLPGLPLVLPIAGVKHLGLACAAGRNERTFTYAGRLVDNLRTNLDPLLVGDILFIQRNIHMLMVTKAKKMHINLGNGQAEMKDFTMEQIDMDLLLDCYTQLHGKKVQEEQARKKAKASTGKAAPQEEDVRELPEQQSDADSDTDAAAVANNAAADLEQMLAAFAIDVGAEGMSEEDAAPLLDEAEMVAALLAEASL
jgi:hypothetical protein